MRNETKKMIRRTGLGLFVLYMLLLLYFLFFSEEYGRVAEAEREFRYNLVPFVEIRRFWVYRHQLGLLALMTNICGNVIGFVPYGYILPVVTRRMQNGWVCSVWIYSACCDQTYAERFSDCFIRILFKPYSGNHSAYYKSGLFRCR